MAFILRDMSSLRRAAVFLCITPFTTALSITLCAKLKVFAADSLSPDSTASNTLLTAVLHLDVQYLLYSLLRSAILTRLSADFLFGINLSPECLCDGAGGETRTPTELPPADFESAASTIPPLRLSMIPHKIHFD